MQKLTVTAWKNMTAKDLILQFPFGTLLLVVSRVRCLKKLREEFDIIRVTEKRWELLANSKGNWVKSIRGLSQAYIGQPDSQVIESTYKETPIYEEFGNGVVSVHIFYKECRSNLLEGHPLRSFKYVSPKLKQYLNKPEKLGESPISTKDLNKEYDLILKDLEKTLSETDKLIKDIKRRESKTRKGK